MQLMCTMVTALARRERKRVHASSTPAKLPGSARGDSSCVSPEGSGLREEGAASPEARADTSLGSCTSGISPALRQIGLLAGRAQVGSAARGGPLSSPQQGDVSFGVVSGTPDAADAGAGVDGAATSPLMPAATSPVSHAGMASPRLSGFREAYSNLQSLSLSSSVDPLPGPLLGADPPSPSNQHQCMPQDGGTGGGGGGKEPLATTPLRAVTPPALAGVHGATGPERGALCPLPANAPPRVHVREKSTSPAVDKPPPKRRPCGGGVRSSDASATLGESKTFANSFLICSCSGLYGLGVC
jgi:hypothetical protein